MAPLIEGFKKEQSWKRINAFPDNRAKYPNVGIPIFLTPLTICEVKFIFTSPINHLT